MNVGTPPPPAVWLSSKTLTFLDSRHIRAFVHSWIEEPWSKTINHLFFINPLLLFVLVPHMHLPLIQFPTVQSFEMNFSEKFHLICDASGTPACEELFCLSLHYPCLTLLVRSLTEISITPHWAFFLFFLCSSEGRLSWPDQCFPRQPEPSVSSLPFFVVDSHMEKFRAWTQYFLRLSPVSVIKPACWTTQLSSHWSGAIW